MTAAVMCHILDITDPEVNGTWVVMSNVTVDTTDWLQRSLVDRRTGSQQETETTSTEVVASMV